MTATKELTRMFPQDHETPAPLPLDGWIPEPASFGERLRLTRQHARLSQIEFARSIGVPHATLSTWERGTTPVSVDIAEIVDRVHEEYGVDRAWLIGWRRPTTS